MVNLSQQTRIFAAVNPIDFRARMDGTAGVCRREYEKDPLDGAVYVFRNRRAIMIRLYFFRRSIGVVLRCENRKG